ncbi:MAG: PqqD family peptide modification chaperone [Bacteroidales bacterium]|nr:PqqD family peptide modification chaperone [Bacteroidales bacterium]
MRIDSRKKIRHVSGENIILMQADGMADMTQVVAFNESALELYNQLNGREFGDEDVVRAITDTYGVDEATARADAAAWVKSMREQKLILD